MSNDNPIFVAYVHSDREAVQPILAVLQTNGLNIWLNEQISPGSDWAAEVGNALQKAPYVLAFVTNKSLQSRWFLSEVHAAFLQSKLKIVLLESISADFPFDISKCRTLDLSGANSLSASEKAQKVATFLAPLLASAIPRAKAKQIGHSEPDAGEIVSRRWASCFPEKLVTGDVKEIDLDLTINELDFLIAESMLADHPVFGVKEREPTIAVKLISLSDGLVIRSLNSDLQWVSNFIERKGTLTPVVWRRQLIASAPGQHKGLLQILIVGADKAGVTIEKQIFELSIYVYVRVSRLSAMKRAVVWLANSAAAGLIGYWIALALK